MLGFAYGFRYCKNLFTKNLCGIVSSGKIRDFEKKQKNLPFRRLNKNKAVAL